MKRKRKQQKKWFLLGLMPLLAGFGWILDRLRKQPIPRKRAIVPAQTTPQAPIATWAEPRIAVTGAVPTLVEDQRYDQAVETAQPSPSGNAGISSIPQPPKSKPQRTATPSAGDPTSAMDQPAGHSIRHHGETSSQSSVPDEGLRAGHALEESTSAERISMYVLLVPFVLLAIAIGLLSRYQLPQQAQVIVPGGDVERGRLALQSWGCGSCHTIPGVVGAQGKVGPNLKEVGMHSFVAGHLENTPENMVLWIIKPQEISPGSGMPDTGVTEIMARDMAAYLYSLSNSQHPGSGVNSFQIKK